MKEIRIAKELFLITALACTAKINAESIKLYNTGVDSSGARLSGGTADPHWTITSGPGVSSPTPAIVLDNQFAYGYAQSPSSSWVWANASGVATFNSPYTYRLTFDLTGLDPKTAVITGNWGVDNVGFIRLNGSTANIGTGALTLLQTTNGNFEHLYGFTLTNGFVAGTNMLEFVVTDNEVGGGLNITDLEGTALWPSIGLFNTGTDSSHLPLYGGDADPHWTIVAGPGISSPTPAVVLWDQYGYSYPQSPVSRWVWANSSGVAAFNSPYTYRLTFSLAGLDPRTAIITGRWGVDNTGYIRLNGFTANIGTGAVSLLQITNGNFENLYGFTLTNGFTAGTNTLEFVVTDSGVAGGLNITELSGAARGLPPSYMTLHVSQVEICWQSAANYHYQLQYRSALTANEWTSLGDPLIGNGARQCIGDPVVEGAPQRFYRILTLP